MVTAVDGMRVSTVLSTRCTVGFSTACLVSTPQPVRRCPQELASGHLPAGR